MLDFGLKVEAPLSEWKHSVENLRLLESPELRKPILISAFAGWADAQEGGTRCVRYLIRHLGATKYAEIDPEEFYDFTTVRPVAFNTPEGERSIRWPKNELYYLKREHADNDLLFLLATEPSLRWRTYVETLFQAWQGQEVRYVLNVGSLMDATPHTRETAISGMTASSDLEVVLAGLRIVKTKYQGPIGITSVFMEACGRKELGYINLWGHAPHYVQRAPNYKVTLALVRWMISAFNLDLSVERLERRSDQFEDEVTKAISASVEMSSYVKRLERQYDEAISGGGALPSGEALVKDIEDQLRQGGMEGGFSSN